MINSPIVLTIFFRNLQSKKSDSLILQRLVGLLPSLAPSSVPIMIKINKKQLEPSPNEKVNKLKQPKIRVN